jgi:hypothetical protein
MQVKKLVLGNVKMIINVFSKENEEVIVAKRRCKITLEDFRNVHVVATQQLAMAENN